MEMTEMRQTLKKAARHVVIHTMKYFMKRYPLAASEILAPILAGHPGNAFHEVFYRHGFHLLRKHFYLPVPDEEDMPEGFWDRRTDLVGLDMNDRQALDLLENVFSRYMEEFRSRFPLEGGEGHEGFFLINGSYMAVDAHVYYALIRHLKPRRIIEIGIGNSTILAGAASLLNGEECGRAAHLTAIDPYAWDLHRKGIPGLSEVVDKKVQEVNLDLFAALEADDILFIDSSHVLREGNDVQYEYMEILPRLAPGVLVHIHDISLPRRYPRVYFDTQLYWNEQYLLQAFLAFNQRFEVLWPGNYIMLKYPEQVCRIFPEFHLMRKYYPQSEPSGFWMRVRS